jgi:dethiobiotin synthetase
VGFVLVTGTGAGVGKTWVTRALARTLDRAGRRVLAVKPVEVGCDKPAPDGEDGALLAAATGQAAPRSALIRYGPRLPPALASGPRAEPVDFDALLL